MEMMSIEAMTEDEVGVSEDDPRWKGMLAEKYSEKIAQFSHNYETSELRCDPDEKHPEASDLTKERINNY